VAVKTVPDRLQASKRAWSIPAACEEPVADAG